MAKKEKTKFITPDIMKSSIIGAFQKLDPRYMIKNPVMFVVELGFFITLVLTIFPTLFGEGGENRIYNGIVTVVLFITVLFANFAESVAEGRGKAQAATLKKTKKDTKARVIRQNGEEEMIFASELRKGDIVLVKMGEVIPNDGEVIEGIASVDESAITGESAPVTRESGGDFSSVTGGTTVVSDWLKIRIVAEPGESFLDKMISLVEGASRQKTPNEIALNTLLIVLTVIFMIVVITLYPFANYLGVEIPISWSIALMVCLIPTTIGGLLSAIGIAGMDRVTRFNVIAMSGKAVEACGDVDTMILDKTGTITKGNFAVQKVTATRKLTEKQVLTMAADCELGSTHPIAVSIVQEARRQNLTLTRPKEVEEISGKGIRATFPEGIVLLGNYTLMEMYQVDTTGYEKGGYGSEVLLAVDGVLEGFVIVADEIKTDAAASVSKMKALGIATVMLTGDEKNSAQAVAKETGIDEVYAQLLPQEKLEHLKNVRKNHGAVMFVGDGINDAPVLAGADVGAAMGSGADAAIEAADVVFMNSSVEAIPQSIAIAKKTGSIAIQNVVFALLIKAIVMILGFLGFANMWLAVFADTGVAMLCVLNSIRAMHVKTK